MNNFTQRIITGALFISVVIASIIFGPLSMQLLFLLVAGLSLLEFIRLVKSGDTDVAVLPTLICGMAAYIVLSFNEWTRFGTMVIILFAFIFITELFRKKQFPFHNIAYAGTGIIYIAVPFAMLVRLGFTQQGFDYRYPLCFFLILWTYDSFAYVFGRWLGRTRLLERVSPKKSWEGFAGGALMALAVAWIISAVTGLLALHHWLVIALLIVLFGTLGDLVESMLKRSLNKKDSGTLLPGHGGLLDRFDAMLLAAPAVYAYLQVIGRISRLAD